jgi:hypothetical protein
MRRAHCHTLPCALPHTATHGRAHCRTQPHTLPHTAALPGTATLPHTHCCTAAHCRTLSHTAAHCRTLPHCQAAAHSPSRFRRQREALSLSCCALSWEPSGSTLRPPGPPLPSCEWLARCGTSCGSWPPCRFGGPRWRLGYGQYT